MDLLIPLPFSSLLLTTFLLSVLKYGTVQPVLHICCTLNKILWSSQFMPFRSHCLHLFLWLNFLLIPYFHNYTTIHCFQNFVMFSPLILSQFRQSLCPCNVAISFSICRHFKAMSSVVIYPKRVSYKPECVLYCTGLEIGKHMANHYFLVVQINYAWSAISMFELSTWSYSGMIYVAVRCLKKAMKMQPLDNILFL